MKLTLKFDVAAKHRSVQGTANRGRLEAQGCGLVDCMTFENCGLRFVVCGLWFMVCGLWFAVCGLWFMVCGLWFVVFGLWFVVCGL